MREHDIRPKALLDEFFELLAGDADKLARQRDKFVEVCCPACGRDSGSEEAFTKQGFPYRLCGDCGTLYASPRPEAAALVDYALNARAVEFWSTHFYKQTAEARRLQIFRPRAALVARLVESDPVAKTGVFVDVGAGYGLFLQEIRDAGQFQEIIGIEPDRRLAGICRGEGFRVVEGWVEGLEGSAVAGDVVTAFEVIEHTFAPESFLAACARLVKPGGLLLFTTLTISGFDLQVLWERSRQISPPQHLNFLSVQGIERLISRLGLQLVSLSTPGQLDLDIVRNALADDPTLSVSRFVRGLTRSDDGTRSAFQQFLREHRLSSHVQCVARRPS